MPPLLQCDLGTFYAFLNELGDRYSNRNSFEMSSYSFTALQATLWIRFLSKNAMYAVSSSRLAKVDSSELPFVIFF